jgi:hypothetical protein
MQTDLAINLIYKYTCFSRGLGSQICFRVIKLEKRM